MKSRRHFVIREAVPLKVRIEQGASSAAAAAASPSAVEPSRLHRRMYERRLGDDPVQRTLTSPGAAADALRDVRHVGRREVGMARVRMLRRRRVSAVGGVYGDGRALTEEVLSGGVRRTPAVVVVEVVVVEVLVQMTAELERVAAKGGGRPGGIVVPVTADVAGESAADGSGERSHVRKGVRGGGTGVGRQTTGGRRRDAAEVHGGRKGSDVCCVGRVAPRAAAVPALAARSGRLQEELRRVAGTLVVRTGSHHHRRVVLHSERCGSK